jgi:hypothetical protein
MHSQRLPKTVEGMKYDTKDVDLRSKMDDVARTIQALPALS